MKTAPSYADFYSRTFIGMKADQGSIRDFTKLCPDGDILELGGGSGRTLGFITARKHILLESDPEMIEKLNKQVRNHPEGSILVGRCPPIPYPSDSLAGVFAAFGTIGEINPICLTLQEIHRVLKPGGYALISTLNPDRYQSPPLGIYRSKLHELEGFSVVSNTLAMNDLGPGEYQTHIWYREPGVNHNFTVRQYFPSVPQWRTLIEQSGLTLMNAPDEMNADPVISLLLHKSEASLARSRTPIESIYDSIGPKYDQFIMNAEYGLPNWLGSHLDRLKGLHPRIIDLACGNGYVGKMLLERSIQPSELIGYDISQIMTQECSKVSTYSSTCRFDISQGLPGIGGLTTDVVSAFGLMEFVSDDAPVIRDIHRILVLGGELLCSFEATEGEVDEDQVEINAGSNKIRRRRRSERSVRDLLNRAGFRKIEVERRQGYRSPTTGMVVNYLYVRAVRENR